jgi:hypothetical protein
MNEAYLLKDIRRQSLFGDNMKVSVYCLFPPYKDVLFCCVSTHLKKRETVIFKSDDKGMVLDWEELLKFKRVIPHEDAMIALGYQIRNP